MCIRDRGKRYINGMQFLISYSGHLGNRMHMVWSGGLSTGERFENGGVVGRGEVKVDTISILPPPGSLPADNCASKKILVFNIQFFFLPR